MKAQKVLLIVVLALLAFWGGVARSFPEYGATFDYDPNLANYEIQGTVHTIPGEAWHCALNWEGQQEDVIVGSYNKPEAMYIDGDQKIFGWTPGPNDIGIHYVDMFIGQRSPSDPNQIWTSDWCTIVIKVEDWIDPPQWLPMCP